MSRVCIYGMHWNDLRREAALLCWTCVGTIGLAAAGRAVLGVPPAIRGSFVGLLCVLALAALCEMARRAAPLPRPIESVAWTLLAPAAFGFLSGPVFGLVLGSVLFAIGTQSRSKQQATNEAADEDLSDFGDGDAIDADLETRLLSSCEEGDIDEPEESDLISADGFRRTHWSTRQLGEDGSDLLTGGWLVHFAEGQQTATVHLPFSPAFAVIPQIECEAVSGPPVRFRTTACHTYGARIEIRREQRESSDDVEVAFAATCDVQPDRSAA